MAQIKVNNPYTGEQAETCSVSFAAQQKLKDTDLSGQQTEAQFNASKMLGEWGVIKGKLYAGELKPGTKLLKVNTSFSEHVVSVVSGGSGFSVKSYHHGESQPYKSLVMTPQAVENAFFNNPPPGWKYALLGSSPAPSHSQAVPAFSDSKGSMTDEDVATLFVSVKDKLANEKGLNIKGANPALDAEVYKAIGEQTGYTSAEAKGKVDAYKASGKKLSALKKKTLKSPKNVADPKPNDVPTKATTAIVEEVAEEVVKEAETKPTKLYSNEDIAAQYIIAKDAIVAASNGKWSLYTKSDELDAAIYGAVFKVTGHSAPQAKNAIAEYLSTGKKLSGLKKTLIKQGKMKAEADTLKKPDPAKKVNTPDPDQTATQAKEEVKDKAESGYTPPEAPEAGGINHIAEVYQKTFYEQYFKTQHIGKYLTDNAASTYEAVLLAIDKANKSDLNKLHNLTPLQALRVIDAYGAVKFKAVNTHPFEKKVVEWLTTPEGKGQASQIQHKIVDKLAAQLKQEESDKRLAEEAKKLQGNQPPLPPDSGLFSVISAVRAQAMQDDMLRDREWTSKERADLRHYTGSNYRGMNRHLRKGEETTQRNVSAIVGAKKGMRPSPENIVVHRGTGLEQLGIEEESVIWGLTGKKLKDKGFMSTSVGGAAAFSGKVQLEIQCPKGTPMAFVKSISHFSHENEMLLQAGLSYRVLRIEVLGGDWNGKKYKVIVRVEND